MAIVKVVKYDGGPDVFAWKYPNQELGTWTQLIVNESQEAILFKSGMAMDVFGPGRHTLETQNIPLLNHLINLPFGGRSPFTAEVWFVNRIHSLDIKWGTATPIQLQDPKYNIFIPVRAHGQFGVRVEDSKKFLLKLVGTLPVLDKASLQKFFRGIYLAKIKDSISSYLVHKKIGILEINAYISELSEHISQQVRPYMEQYGIEVVNFFINDISVPENDPSVVQLRKALTKRAEMDIIGYNYQQERSFDTIEGAAKNPGAGTPTAYMMGVGAPMASTVGQFVGSIANNLNPENLTECTRCQSKVQKDKRFCPDCGHDMHLKAETKTIRCSKCDAVLAPSVKFCPECGDKYNPCPNCAMDVMEDAANCHACGYAMPKPCANCGASIAQDVKFCPECGASTVKTCEKCGHELADDVKFCPECGQKA